VGLPGGRVELRDPAAAGAVVETLDLSALGTIDALEYLPATRELAIKTTTPGEERTLHVLGRDGTPHRTLVLDDPDLHVIDGVAHFTDGDGDGAGRLLVIDHPFVGSRALVFGLDGRRVSSFDYRATLGVVRPFEVTAVTTGPHAGSLALVDDYASELVIFRLP
jgi:hypothetical protein